MSHPKYVLPISEINEAEQPTPAKNDFQKYQSQYPTELKKKEDADSKYAAGTITGDALIAAYDAFTTFQKAYQMSQLKAKIESSTASVTTPAQGAEGTPSSQVAPTPGTITPPATTS